MSVFHSANMQILIKGVLLSGKKLPHVKHLWFLVPSSSSLLVSRGWSILMMVNVDLFSGHRLEEGGARTGGSIINRMESTL